MRQTCQRPASRISCRCGGSSSSSSAAAQPGVAVTQRAGRAAVVLAVQPTRAVQASVQQTSQITACLVDRRQLLRASLFGSAAVLLGCPGPAAAGIERYVKKKSLDPLDTYVPLVLEARERLASLGDVMGQDPSVARQLMRSGPFAGLRDNIRALGQYAAAPPEQGGSGLAEAEASELVASFFRALEDYDLVLYNAVREAKAAAAKAAKEAEQAGEGGSEPAALDPAAGLDQEAAAAKLQAAVQRLDRLIASVPADVLARSRQVLERISAKQGKPAQAAGGQ